MGRLAVIAILVGLQYSDGLQQTDKTDRVSALSAQAELNTKPVPASNSAEGKPRFVAWLISGQVSRFIYKDSTKYIDGGVWGWSGCSNDRAEECSVSVDVHIALANTHVKQFRGPQYTLPSYGDGAFEEPAINAHYRSLMMGNKMQQKVALMKKSFYDSGAREVRVTIVDGAEFEVTMQRVREQILTRAQASSDLSQREFDGFWNKLPGHENRFEQNGNMMYMRHLAYSSAVEAEAHLPYAYTHVLYTREDNVFVHPSYTLLQLAMDMDHEAEPSRSPAAVLVDQRCGWHAWSDKLYFASRRGIDVLFARTLKEHIAQMAKWINMARTSQSVAPGDPLMTEEYFKRLLEDARTNVTKFDFLRTELRYQDLTNLTGDTRRQAEQPCIPELYKSCTSVGAGFATCPTNSPSSHHKDHPVKERPSGRYVAWLISGQVSRFLYKDSTKYIDGGIQRWSGMSGCSGNITKDCNISVDVHIALANTNVASAMNALPTYEDGGFEEPAITGQYSNVRGTQMQEKVALMKMAFSSAGAREVRVTIVNGSEFDKTMQQFRGMTLNRAKQLKVSRMQSSASESYDRFEQHIKMMYMRHLAYSSAAKAEANLPYRYTHVLYTREDNIFMHPAYTLLQLARDMDHDAADGPRSRTVLMDRRCEADSVYFASRRGMDVLITSSRDLHVAQMAKFISEAQATSPDVPLTMVYFQRQLEAAHANVTHFDFVRTQGRYMTGVEKPCVFDGLSECFRLADDADALEGCPDSSY